MSRVWNLIKLLAFGLLTLGTMAGVVLARGLTLGRNGNFLRWKNRILTGWASGCFTIFGLRLTVEGNPPKGPFILVSNHLSYLDVVPLWYLTDATFVAKQELSGWAFFGWAMRRLEVIFIDRANIRDLPRVNREIARHLDLGEGIIFFPEGTSTKGDKIHPFNAPLLHYAARNRHPVHYVSIGYKTRDPEKPASRYVCWWGDMDFIGHFMDFITLRRVEITLRFGEEPVVSGDRKNLAEELENNVSRLFEPIG
ncbi:MAG: lysophospholipid acyltransferase family protein [Balneolaceae bacterium]|nr:lysophospholipid acyltransferase family protein [Balneolaceae bacterium]